MMIGGEDHNQIRKESAFSETGVVHVKPEHLQSISVDRSSGKAGLHEVFRAE